MPQAPLEIIFQEQSYCSLYSRQSLAWDHFCGFIHYPCGVIGDPYGIIDNPCGIIVNLWGDWRSLVRRSLMSGLKKIPISP